MGIVEKIYQFVDYKMITINEFSNKIGVSNGYFAKQRTNSANIGSHIIAKIVRAYPEINLKWLFLDDGEMITKDNGDAPIEPLSHTVDRNIDNQLIPMYDSEVAAGFSMIVNSDVVPSDYISIPNLPVCDGAVLVRGESMSPKLHSGDIVIYKMINNPQRIIWNDMYIVSFMTDGDFYTVIKIIKKSQTSDFIQLASINPEHEPFEIPIDSIQQLAQVRASIQYHTM